MRIILASASPRRRELLARAGLEFGIEAAKVDESLSDKALRDPHGAAQLLAQRKSSAVACQVRDKMRKDLNAGCACEQTYIIGADTMVVLDGRIFGKPQDEGEAVEMLRTLSNRQHEVITGVSVFIVFVNRKGKVDIEEVTFDQTSFVKFKNLSEADIEAYVACGESMDKAGAYAIQGEGGKLVEFYDGDYDNIVGLPVERLFQVCPELRPE